MGSMTRSPTVSFSSALIGTKRSIDDLFVIPKQVGSRGNIGMEPDNDFPLFTRTLAQVFPQFLKIQIVAIRITIIPESRGIKENPIIQRKAHPLLQLVPEGVPAIVKIVPGNTRFKDLTILGQPERLPKYLREERAP